MKLHVLGSSSKGNGYIMQADTGEALILEAGIPLKKIKAKLNYDISKVSGVLISHEDSDHSKYIMEYVSAGFQIYSAKETLEYLKIFDYHNCKPVDQNIMWKAGRFKFKPFSTYHDAVNPFGYLIFHGECGLTLFLTDTCFSRYLFPKLNNILIECNYDDAIIDERLKSGTIHPALYDRIKSSHMSFDTCKKLLKANDLSLTQKIILIHLSDGNSDENLFVKQIKKLTGKAVYAASEGLTVEINAVPF